MRSAAYAATALIVALAGGANAKNCFWDFFEGCLSGGGYCCSSTWHTLEDKPKGKKHSHGRFLAEGSSDNITNDFSGIPDYLDDRLADGTLPDDEYEWLSAYFNGLKTCREYERGITAATSSSSSSSSSDDDGEGNRNLRGGERNLGSNCFWDFFEGCLSGGGYCCSSTWHTLKSGKRDRYLEAITSEPVSRENVFEGIPKYLTDRLGADDITHDEYVLMDAYYQGLKTCREHERANGEDNN